MRSSADRWEESVTVAFLMILVVLLVWWASGSLVLGLVSVLVVNLLDRQRAR